MSLRDLVSGSGGCEEGSTSSNPASRFADAVLGASWTPSTSPGFVKASNSRRERTGPSTEDILAWNGNRRRTADETNSDGALGEIDEVYVEEYLRGGQSAAEAFYQGAWEGGFQQAFHEVNEVANRGGVAGSSHSEIIPSLLHSFLDERHPFVPVALSDVRLSPVERMKIKFRSGVLARQLFVDRGPAFLAERMHVLMNSLGMDSTVVQPLTGWHPTAADAATAGQLAASRSWADEFARGESMTTPWANEFLQRNVSDPSSWVAEFRNNNVSEAWAERFRASREQVERQESLSSGPSNEGMRTMQEQSRAIAETLSSSDDPRMANSQFLRFISKMSRGEIEVKEGGVVPTERGENTGVSDGWAKEYVQGDRGWAHEFQNQRSEQWAAEFDAGEGLPAEEMWASEYARLHTNGSGGTGELWADEFLRHLDGYPAPDLASVAASYRFVRDNPYDQHPSPLEEGKRLFREGLLSEAILALESECKRNGNAESWRLLGNIHAENDDDASAIAALSNALQSDPQDLEAMLSLGVSYTNQLEQTQALAFLNLWLENHPLHRHIAEHRPPAYEDESQRLHLTILGFLQAATEHPDDADVHEVLGVLYNLQRNFDRAAEEFREALRLRPTDYSLWNKVGSSLANGSRCVESIPSYRRALDLKPSYVRAWSNLGIAHANLGEHDAAARYYIRALHLHPGDSDAWSYLRVSLVAMGRSDGLVHVDRKNLDPLREAFPLRPSEDRSRRGSS